MIGSCQQWIRWTAAAKREGRGIQGPAGKERSSYLARNLNSQTDLRGRKGSCQRKPGDTISSSRWNTKGNKVLPEKSCHTDSASLAEQVEAPGLWQHLSQVIMNQKPTPVPSSHPFTPDSKVSGHRARAPSGCACASHWIFIIILGIGITVSHFLPIRNRPAWWHSCSQSSGRAKANVWTLNPYFKHLNVLRIVCGAEGRGSGKLGWGRNKE